MESLRATRTAHFTELSRTLWSKAETFWKEMVLDPWASMVINSQMRTSQSSTLDRDCSPWPTADQTRMGARYIPGNWLQETDLSKKSFTNVLTFFNILVLPHINKNRFLGWTTRCFWKIDRRSVDAEKDRERAGGAKQQTQDVSSDHRMWWVLMGSFRRE